MTEVLERTFPTSTVVRRRRGRWVALAVAVTIVAALVAASQGRVEGEGTGQTAVKSDRAEVVRIATPSQEPVFLVSADPGARVTLLFPLHTTSRLPVRIEEVVVPGADPECGWQQDRVLTSLRLGEPFVPFAPLWLSRDEALQVSVSGTFLPCEPYAAFGLRGTDVAQVRYRPAGLLPRSDDVPLGYDFSWTSEPLADVEDVVTQQAPGLEGTF